MLSISTHSFVDAAYNHEENFFKQLSITKAVNVVVNEPDQEFRSLFIATAWNVDWPTSSSDTVANHQQQMLNYLNMMANTNMNAVVFQVRPVGDAMYYSDIEPWSRFVEVVFTYIRYILPIN